MATKRKKFLDRRGEVAAVDFKFTGKEPSWTDAESISIEDYNDRKSKALLFYNYYLDSADMRPWVIDWMQSNGYDKSDVSAIKGLPPTAVVSTVGKLVRMLQRGMPDCHPSASISTSASKFIHDHLKDAIKDYHFLAAEKKSQGEEDDSKPKPAVKTPLQRLEAKVNNEVIVHLEELLDKVAEVESGDTPTKMPYMDVSMLLRSAGIPAKGAKFVVDWLTTHHAEFKAAVDRTCPDAVEGYSYLRKPQLNRIVANFEKMIDGAATHSKVKSTRRPRVKRPKAADKQVARLKYCQEDDTYSLQSIDPISIPFSQRVYVFNTKYRQLSIYYSSTPSGFSVKGTSIKEFDPDKSITMTLRKPEDVLPLILSGTVRKIDNLLKTLKTKPRKANGRINNNTVLLKAFDKA